MEIDKGLKNTFVDSSSICFIDGNNSRLYYRGYDINLLVDKSSFEEVAYLLLYGKFPLKQEFDNFNRILKSNQNLPKFIKSTISNYPKNANIMDVLRTGVSSLGLHNADYNNFEKSINIIGSSTSITTLYSRVKNNDEIVEPLEDLSYAGNFLYMLKGKKPDEFDSKILDIIFILHAEHEMNASAFSCIVTSSTLSDIYSSITAGIGTLKGPLHGGANEGALKTILAVGSPENAEDYVSNALKKGERVMGFGHRVYRNYDPRYIVLKKVAKKLAEKKNQLNLYNTANEIENITVEKLSGKGIFPNVDSYSGLVLHLLDIPIELFTPIFAISRNPGWCAHILEYTANNVLIRPKTHYDGKLDLSYIPIDKR